MVSRASIYISARIRSEQVAWKEQYLANAHDRRNIESFLSDIMPAQKIFVAVYCACHQIHLWILFASTQLDNLSVCELDV